MLLHNTACRFPSSSAVRWPAVCIRGRLGVGYRHPVARGWSLRMSAPATSPCSPFCWTR